MAGGGDKSTPGDRTNRPTSSKTKGGKGGGGGGGSPADACDISFEKDVFSPDPAVAAKISVGQSIQVTLDGKVVAITVPALKNERLGTLAALPAMAELVKCLQKSVKFEGKILKASGGNIIVSVWRKP